MMYKIPIRAIEAVGPLAAALLTAACAAHAADSEGGAAQVPLSRAEVLADLQIWQQSGMSAFDNGEASADPSNASYSAAQARYVALRSSPEFSQLVSRIAQERGDVMVAR
jgi:hypothetical protein